MPLLFALVMLEALRNSSFPGSPAYPSGTTAWFASTTSAANENRTPDEGLSHVLIGTNRFTFQQAVAECGSILVGEIHLEQARQVACLRKVL